MMKYDLYRITYEFFCEEPEVLCCETNFKVALRPDASLIADFNKLAMDHCARSAKESQYHRYTRIDSLGQVEVMA